MRDRFGSWAYEPVALDALGLSWPKIQALQAEVKHLISQHAEAALAVTTLESGRRLPGPHGLSHVRGARRAEPPKGLYAPGEGSRRAPRRSCRSRFWAVSPPVADALVFGMGSCPVASCCTSFR